MKKPLREEGVGFCRELKTHSTILAYPLIKGIFGESSRFENGGIGDRANRDALW
jgi:hypothetical protein